MAPPDDPQAIAAWWSTHQARVATEQSAGDGHANYILTPGSFDVTVAQGESVQVAVDRCPEGGSVLLLPGTHVGGVVLSKTVHLFGRGKARLRAADGDVLTSTAPSATVDGLIIRREPGGADHGIWVQGGRLRLQACDIVSASAACVAISRGADPVVHGCR